MKLHSDYPYWMIKTGLFQSFPALNENIETEVLLIGGGITAALIAQKLAKEGIDTLIVEKGHIGHGSTAASTAILQYELDVPLFKLQNQIGVNRANKAYLLCAEAIDSLEKTASGTRNKSDFESHPSLYFASFKKDLGEIILPEYEARKKAGLSVEFIDKGEIKRRFGFNSEGGILSEKAAHLNPYLLCHSLFQEVNRDGNRVFSHTEVVDWKKEKGKMISRTVNGVEIKARYIIVACGYESQLYLDKKVTDFDSTFAIVSLPLDSTVNWEKNAILWETKNPYLYMRTTSDNRIIVGGRDEEFSDAGKRDRLVNKKQQQLENDFKKLFPEIPFETDFAWAGTFGKTKDALPYIGPFRNPQVLYAMGYGGNGITFSQVAANFLFDKITRGENASNSIFSFDR